MVVDYEPFDEVLAPPLEGSLSPMYPDSPALLLDKLADPLGHRNLGKDDVWVGRVTVHALKCDLPAIELPFVEASYALLGSSMTTLGSLFVMDSN